MYVIINNNRVILGILPWKAKYFRDVLKIRHKITVTLPETEPDSSEFPYIIDENTVIKRAEENRSDNINPMTEYYYGPLWEFVDDKVIANYEVKIQDLDSAKGNYRQKAAMLRYENEVSGTKITIDDVEHFIETSRDARAKYIEKYIMMGDDPISWKFREGWQTITKQNMLDIVHAVDAHVQGTFDEELDLVEQVNAATSIESLLNIEPLNKVDTETELLAE
jgi:hypothetical protein